MGRNINPKTGHGYSWKGDNISYRRLHTWLRETYGSASICENPKCPKTCSTFQWSLRKKKKYLRLRENFWRLCALCHSKYDGHGEKVRKKLTGQMHTEERKRKIGLANKGKIWTAEERLILSIAQKKRHANKQKLSS